MKAWLCARIGSPFVSKGAVTTLLYSYSTISTLLEGNTGESGGTKAMPSGPLLMFARRLADVMLNVPLLSRANWQWYQPPPPQETSYMLPAPGNSAGTKPIEPPEPVTPSGAGL